MATVQDIVTNGKSIAATVLGATWREMRRAFEPEKNDSRDAEKSYGFVPAEADFDPTGVLGYETLDQAFFLVLQDTIPRNDSDTDVQTVLSTLYTKGDLIFKQYVQTRLSLPSTVLKVDSRSIEAPVIAKGAVYLRMRFVVKYRQYLL